MANDVTTIPQPVGCSSLQGMEEQTLSSHETCGWGRLAVIGLEARPPLAAEKKLNAGESSASSSRDLRPHDGSEQA